MLYPLTFERKAALDKQVRIDFVLPASFTRIAALDFKGLAADFQLLQAIFFIGEKIENSELITLKDWQHFKRSILAVIDLDPYFSDPYYFSGALLAWGPHLYDDALEILDKGLKYRKDDFHIPFMMGFIHFYFLKNHKKGAEYLEIAAMRPGAPKVFFTKLASRLAYYAGSYEFSLSLLETMLQTEKNTTIRKVLLKRKQATEGAVILEKALVQYRKKNNKLPTNINQLLEEKIIDKLPVEPYGGEWILLKRGRIFTTSKFVEKRDG